MTPRSVLGVLGFGGQKVSGKHRWNHVAERYIARDEGQGKAKGNRGQDCISVEADDVG